MELGNHIQRSKGVDLTIYSKNSKPVLDSIKISNGLQQCPHSLVALSGGPTARAGHAQRSQPTSGVGSGAPLDILVGFKSNEPKKTCSPIIML
jgi:hypothetical protein